MKLHRVGVVMLGSVGGAVWTLPILNAIKRHAPHAHITWVMQPGPATLVRSHPAVDEIILLERSRGTAAFLDVRRALRATSFDVVLSLQVYLKAGIVTSFTHAPVKLGFDRARTRDLSWMFTNRRLPPRLNQHAQDEYLEFVPALGLPEEPAEWRIGPYADERPWQREFFAGFDRPAVTIVVATSKAEKDWLPERWAQVTDALWHDFKLAPVLVGGRSDRELHADRVIRELARHKPVSMLGCGLRKVASILDGSVLALSPDTGPLHMAVALERPVVSLMGYTNPKRTGPYRRYQDLIVDAYGDAGETYAASTRVRPGRMERITVRDVLDRVERWRTSYAGSIGPKG